MVFFFFLYLSGQIKSEPLESSFVPWTLYPPTPENAPPIPARLYEGVSSGASQNLPTLLGPNATALTPEQNATMEQFLSGAKIFPGFMPLLGADVSLTGFVLNSGYGNHGNLGELAISDTSSNTTGDNNSDCFAESDSSSTTCSRCRSVDGARRIGVRDIFGSGGIEVVTSVPSCSKPSSLMYDLSPVHQPTDEDGSRLV